MLKKRVFNSLITLFSRISAWSLFTKLVVFVVLSTIIISIGYGIRSLTNKGQVAEITNLPATPPIPYGTIDINTGSVLFQATNISISMNSNIINSFSVLPFPNNFYSSNAINGNTTTLEGTVSQNGITSNIYFEFETIVQNSQWIWRITQIRTFDPFNGWVSWTNGSPELFNSYYTSNLYLPSAYIDTIVNGNYLVINIENLNLQVFQSQASPSIFPYPSPSQSPICTRQSPLITIQPGNQNGLPGETLTYNVDVTNKDTEACGPSEFGFGTMINAPFTANPAVVSNYLPAGGTLHTTLTVTSPTTNPWNEQRSVPVSFSATNFLTGLNSSITASYTLLAPAPQTVYMSFKLAGVNNNAAEGAKVNVKFYLKNGSVLTLSEPLVLSHTQNGVYTTSATINNPFHPGTEYRLKVKGEKHISIEFCKENGQTEPCGDNDYITMPSTFEGNYGLSLVGIPLPPGDLATQDGRANIEDLNKLKPLMGKPQSSLTNADLLIGDVNYDGFINIYDVFLILKTVETRYDD